MTVDFHINKKRLWHHIHEMGKIGRKEDGLHCVALTKEDMEGIALLRTFMEEAGLSVRYDSAGNLIGRKEGRFPELPIVMTGSHSDTVYGGGMFDGRLGILGAIEALQSMNEQGIQCDHPIEVYAYRDEEGNRFPRGYSSARFLAGTPRHEIFETTDKDGITMYEALVSCGIKPGEAENAKLPEGYVKAHLELHIEQGSVLERENLPVGVVSGIFCQARGFCTIDGVASHSGTTPMDIRKDALCGAAELILAVEKSAKSRSDAVATVGKCEIAPDAINVVPGNVRLSFDIRMMEPEDVRQLIAEIHDDADRIARERELDLHFDLPLPEGNSSKLFNTRVRGIIADSIAEMDLPVRSLPSGAGHDSGVFCNRFPCGMIFVRSKDGISHNKAEFSSMEDCAAGAEVLGRSIMRLADKKCVI